MIYQPSSDGKLAFLKAEVARFIDTIEANEEGSNTGLIVGANLYRDFLDARLASMAALHKNRASLISSLRRWVSPLMDSYLQDVVTRLVDSASDKLVLFEANNLLVWSASSSSTSALRLKTSLKERFLPRFQAPGDDADSALTRYYFYASIVEILNAIRDINQPLYEKATRLIDRGALRALPTLISQSVDVDKFSLRRLAVWSSRLHVLETMFADSKDPVLGRLGRFSSLTHSYLLSSDGRSFEASGEFELAQIPADEIAELQGSVGGMWNKDPIGRIQSAMAQGLL